MKIQQHYALLYIEYYPKMQVESYKKQQQQNYLEIISIRLAIFCIFGIGSSSHEKKTVSQYF